MTNAAVIRAIEDYANPSLQEQWDNTGLQVGSPHAQCTGVLVCLDPTPAVVEEAISRGCNLIVTHHPLFFKPVKRLTGTTLPQATAINAIAAGISIYSSHTAADSTKGGVSYLLAKKLGVTPLRTLSPLQGRLVALTAIVPQSHAYSVQAALFDAGAGAIGNYDCCSFSVKGEGTFRPLDGAQPFTGAIGESHTDNEVALHLVLEAEIMPAVEAALLEAHPYETPAYQFMPMLNADSNLGLGIYGVIEDDAPTPEQFARLVKEALGCKAMRATKVDLGADAKIRRVAVCGGAGGDFIQRAISMGAQAYVTADIRYHDFVEYRDQILLIDAGHYETEHPIVDTFCHILADKFPTLPVYASEIQDNPINYIF